MRRWGSFSSSAPNRWIPVADVNTNPDNTVISDRAFSSDPEVVVSEVVVSEVFTEIAELVSVTVSVIAPNRSVNSTRSE